jgi:hypothetical protein
MNKTCTIPYISTPNNSCMEPLTLISPLCSDLVPLCQELSRAAESSLVIGTKSTQYIPKIQKCISDGPSVSYEMTCFIGAKVTKFSFGKQ